MLTNADEQRLLLAQCASEPIQWLGRTQGFGLLLAFHPQDRRIVACSANAHAWLGRSASALQGRSVDELLTRRNVDAACAHAAVAAVQGVAQHLHRVAWPGRQAPVDLSLHMGQGLVVLEAEPWAEAPAGATAAIEACTRELTLARSVAELAESAVQAVARITGYSRVMLYRFSADGSGTVIAERLAGDRPSYLGLRYPASDIPAQARLLYLRNLTRVIEDARDEGLPLVRSGDPLELTLSVLRSVSPVHLAYMRNMGSAASMSVSLVVDGRLWGLIACHHHEPKRPPLSVRSLAELMGRLYSLALARSERQGLDLDVKTLLLSPPGVEPLVDPLSAPALFAGACEVIDRLFDISGVALHIDGRLRTWGSVPDAAAVLAAAQDTEPRRAVVPVESLAAVAPAYARLAPETAGMLALPLGAHGRDWLLLLRDEVRRHVKWAGDPRLKVSRHDGRLSPRRSFEVWEEIVRGHCEPWTRVEIELAEVLRIRLLEVLLAHREQRELEAARLAAQQQSLLVRELNHRVRNMLGLIKGLVHQTASGCASVEDLTARLDDRVHALSRAYTQIERANWRPTALQTLVTEETRAFAEPGQVNTSGEPVSLESNAYLSFALVIHELTTNARKYGALSVPQGRLDVSWRVAADGHLEIDWQESGGPAVAQPQRCGFGTRVIGQALAHQLHGEASLDFRPAGLHAHLGVPRGFVVGAPPPVPQPSEPRAIERARLPRRVLVLEDDLVIALLAETLLHQLGCPDVVLAGSRDEALAALDGAAFDVAVLDVNLGDHTSESVAEQLAVRGVPVVVATGYSDTDLLPQALRAHPRVCKPYAKDELARALSQAMRADAGAPALSAS